MLELAFIVGIIYLIVKYDKKKYVWTFFKTCFQMLAGGIWRSLMISIGFRNSAINKSENIITSIGRDTLNSMTDFRGQFRNNLKWAVKDYKLQELEDEVKHYRKLYEMTKSPSHRELLKLAESKLRKARSNRF